MVKNLLNKNLNITSGSNTNVIQEPTFGKRASALSQSRKSLSFDQPSAMILIDTTAINTDSYLLNQKPQQQQQQIMPISSAIPPSKVNKLAAGETIAFEK